MNLFYVTLFHGRTYNFYIEPSSKQDIINLIEEHSHSKILSIKKVVYSKEHDIGKSWATAQKLTNPLLRVMVKTQNYTGIIELFYVFEHLNKIEITNYIKKHLLYNNEKITTVLSMVVQDA